MNELNQRKGQAMIKGYWSTKDLCERYRCCGRTIARWTKRKNNPFPKPRIVQNGASNLWAIDDVEQWENPEPLQEAA